MYIGSFAAVSNRMDWTNTIYLIDSVTGDDIDITGCIIVMAVRHKDRCQMLQVSVGSGIEITGTSSFTFTFSKQQMHCFCAGTYDVGITIADENDERTSQLFAGSVPIVDGIVP